MVQKGKNLVYSAEVKEVFSGDDLILMVDLGIDSLFKRKRVRLDGVDTPNAVRLPFDSAAGQIRGFVKTLVLHKQVRLTVTRATDSEWAGIVEVETKGVWSNLNDLLISKGFGFHPEKASHGN